MSNPPTPQHSKDDNPTHTQTRRGVPLVVQVALGALALLIAVPGAFAVLAYFSIRDIPVEGTAISTKFIKAQTVMKHRQGGRGGYTITGKMTYTSTGTEWYLQTKDSCYQVMYKTNDGKKKTDCVNWHDFDSIKPGKKFSTTKDRVLTTETLCADLAPGTCEQRVAEGMKVVQ
jgi:hypothetical protein